MISNNINGFGSSYLKDHISLYVPAQVLRSSGEAFLSVPPLSPGVFGWNTGEGLLSCCSQTLELPPTGSQAGPIFAVLPQASEEPAFPE